MDDPHAIRHPHDALFRAALGDPERAAELLRSVLSPDLIAAIDWTSLRRIDATFIDEALRHQQADLLFAATIGGREALIYLLLEHKSGDVRFTAFQLTRYIVRIWEQFRRDLPNATHLPPILPSCCTTVRSAGSRLETCADSSTSKALRRASSTCNSSSASCSTTSAPATPRLSTAAGSPCRPCCRSCTCSSSGETSTPQNYWSRGAISTVAYSLHRADKNWSLG
ncbi:MAG: Rpn family recombination-promoting nuclease/putative transposase [Planctomycetota bacterium]